MKPLTFVNADSYLILELQKYYEMANGISENVIIDWYPPKQSIEQINILENAIKNKSNIVLFDRYMSLKQHEIDWLLRYKNVHLFEPCLITRKGFEYMPFWYKAYEGLDESLDVPERTSIGVMVDPDRVHINYEYDLPKCKTYLEVNMTMLFCNEAEYNRGYLPDMSNILYAQCVPLLPGRHKYYWKLFHGLVVNSQKDLDWCTTMLKLYDALLYGIYDNMEKYFPEMLVENVAHKIKSILT